MRAIVRLLALMACLCFSLPSFAAAGKQMPSPHVKPPGTIYLRDWAEKNGFKLSYDQKALTVSLTNRWATMEFLTDSRRGEINGISVWLSFPIRTYNGRLLITQKDLTTLVEPILFPKHLPAERKIRIVALDPGHGGKDPGYQIGNHQEKKYTLLLAKEVQNQLEDAGLKSFLTRRTDMYVERSERADVAHGNKADLFVSLHYNTAADPSAKGVETYAVTPFGAEATNGGETALRSWPGNKFDAQSVLLAFEVQRSITHSLDLSDRGVRRAGFEVLRKAQMPSILIESGFMSNTSDSKKVFDDDHRKEMARAIVDGILAFKRIMERTTVKE